MANIDASILFATEYGIEVTDVPSDKANSRFGISFSGEVLHIGHLSFETAFVSDIARVITSGECTTPGKTNFGVSFSGEIITSGYAWNTNNTKFGVSFNAYRSDISGKMPLPTSFGFTLYSDIIYGTPSVIIPDTVEMKPTGDIQSFAYYSKTVNVLPLIPTAIGQSPTIEVTTSFLNLTVRATSHLEQRRNHLDWPMRKYTFDYVLFPTDYNNVMNIMENLDRCPVAVPLFNEMYQLTRILSAGDSSIYIRQYPELHLWLSKYVMLIDGTSKAHYILPIDYIEQIIPDTSGEIQTEVTSSDSYSTIIHVNASLEIDIPKNRYMVFPVLIGWVDSFTPQQLNRKIFSGTLEVNEYVTGDGSSNNTE
jgi:hypothetical protein